MEVYLKSSWLVVLLGLFFFTTTLSGVQGDVDGQGPTESECRPYIEKALKELEAGETENTEPLNVDFKSSNEELPTIEITTDDSNHSESDINPDSIETNETEEVENLEEDNDDDNDNESGEVGEQDDSNEQNLSAEVLQQEEINIAREELLQEASKESDSAADNTENSNEEEKLIKNYEQTNSDENSDVPDSNTSDNVDNEDDDAVINKIVSDIDDEQQESAKSNEKDDLVIEEENQDDDILREQEEVFSIREKDILSSIEIVYENDEEEALTSREREILNGEEESSILIRKTRDVSNQYENNKEEDSGAEDVTSSEATKAESADLGNEVNSKEDTEVVQTSNEEATAQETETPDSKESEEHEQLEPIAPEVIKENSEEQPTVIDVEEAQDSKEEKDDSRSAEVKSDQEEPKSVEQEDAVSVEQVDVKSAEQDSKSSEQEDAKSAEPEDSKSVEQEETKSVEQKEIKSAEQEETKSTEQEETKSTEQEETKSTEQEETKSVEQEETKSAEQEEIKSAEQEETKSSEQEETKSSEQEETKSSEQEETKSSEKEESKSVEQEESKSVEQEESHNKSVEHADTLLQKDQESEIIEMLREFEVKTTKEAEETEHDVKVDTEAVVEELVQEEEEIIQLRPRDHVNQILKLDQESSEIEQVIGKTSEVILKDLKKLYESAIKPLETLYKYRDLSNRHFGDAEIFSKPLVLFMGPWSGGKSSIINYLLDVEYNETSLHTGAEPSPAYFNIVMHGEEPEILDGTELAADYTFSGLQKFGQGLEERLRGYKLPSKLLQKVNIVEIPGILEVRKQVSRVFPFNDACQWFIDRADIIFLVYDPSKLDVGPETEAILDQLKGREYQTRIVLNKADQVKPEELMRVQGALIWNISPLMSSAQPPVMYTTSLWSKPYESWAPVRLLQAQERAFLRDLRVAVEKRIDNKISSARRFAVRVRNHAKMVDCYLTTYYNHKSVFGNRKQVSDEIINHPQDYHIYEGLSTLTNISRYDLPDPDVYRDFFKLNALYEFQQLSATCTYFRGCPINRLDIAIAYDLPELVGKNKRLIETALNKLNTATPGS